MTIADFQALELAPGDVVSLTAKTLATEVPAAIWRVGPNSIETMSTLLKLIQPLHNGFFAAEDINRIVVTRRAAEAVPQESRNGWAPGTILESKDGRFRGPLLCAFDGLVAIDHPGLAPHVACGGGACHFREISQNSHNEAA